MNHRRILAALVAAALILAACGGDDVADTAPAGPDATSAPATSAPAPDDQANQNEAATAATAEAPTEEPLQEQEPAEDEAPPEPDPSEVVDAAAEPQPLQFNTPDGEVLTGAVFGDGNVGIVLAHMRGADKTTWYPFARNAAQAGYSALAFDFRGYGESTGERDTDLDVDLFAAIGALRSQGATSIVVMGASMGATATINVASRVDLAAAVSLSAPGEFIGLPATDVAADVAEPLLIIAAENDHPYVDAAIEIDSLAPITQLQILPGNAHGTNLFAEFDAELTTLLLEFVSGRAG